MVTIYKNGVLSYHTPTGLRIAYVEFINLTAQEIDTHYREYADEFYNETF